MNLNDADFLVLLRETFRMEAEEHLAAMATGLQQLDKKVGPQQQAEIVERIFREAHSLKGAARAVNDGGIEDICQSVEDVFARWKRGEESPTPESIAQMLVCVDNASSLLAGAKPVAATGEPAHAPLPVPAISPPSVVPPDALPVPAPAPERNPGSEMIRIPAARLDGLIAMAEEFLPAKLAGAQHVADLRDLENIFEGWQTEWSSVRGRIRDVQTAFSRGGAPDAYDLSRMLAFVGWNSQFIRLAGDKLTAISRNASRERQEQDKRVGELLTEAKRLAMTPCSILLAPLSKMVRELGRESGRDAELVTRGGDLEMDKHVLEELKDPLTHIIRNCMAHGIEEPVLRRERGKPARGTIAISIAKSETDRTVITISDDGGGLDLPRLTRSALQQGVITDEQAGRMTEQDAARLMFLSGVSTASQATELSGRGLGMAIVHEKIINLGGTISIATRPGKGTTFALSLPTTRSTFRATMVMARGMVFAIPTNCIEQTRRLTAPPITSRSGKYSVTIAGNVLDAVPLADALCLPRSEQTNEGSSVLVVLRYSGSCIGLLVDAVHMEAEVPVRPLGRTLPHVRNIAAATVLEDGQIVPVIHVADTSAEALRLMAAGSPAAAQGPRKASGNRGGSILIVEDSITSRLLVKSVLELAGYATRTAVDGVDALLALNSGTFDLVISDVDMPRMSGLELTRRIRADSRTASLPVILMTALATLQDRERGLQAGANDYIIKSSVHHGDILASITRMLAPK